jgi:hypothetical protein
MKVKEFILKMTKSSVMIVINPIIEIISSAVIVVINTDFKFIKQLIVS